MIIFTTDEVYLSRSSSIGSGKICLMYTIRGLIVFRSDACKQSDQAICLTPATQAFDRFITRCLIVRTVVDYRVQRIWVSCFSQWRLIMYTALRSWRLLPLIAPFTHCILGHFAEKDSTLLSLCSMTVHLCKSMTVNP